MEKSEGPLPATLLAIVPATVALALAVDIGVLLSWMRKRQ